MRIYWIKAQAPRRVLALAKHLGVEAELYHLDLRRGDLREADFAGLNPNMKVPVLVDGDVVLWESSAIMALLCVRRGSDMWPAQDPSAQVEILRWLSWNDCHWGPALSPFYFEHIVRATFRMGPPDRKSLEAKVPELLRFAAVLEGHLQGRSYVSCDRLTIADFQLASMAADWTEAEMPLNAFPNIVRWLAGLNEIEAWAHPWPEAPVTFEQRTSNQNRSGQ
jgi:glutathione S-transferase